MRCDFLKTSYLSRNNAGFHKKLPIKKKYLYGVGFGSKIGDPTKFEYWEQDILNYAATMTNQLEKSKHDLMYITSDFVREREKEQQYNPKNLWCECRDGTTQQHFISVIEKMESKELPLMNKSAHHIPNMKEIWKKLFFSFASKCLVIKSRINVQNDSRILKRLRRTFQKNANSRFLILINEDRTGVDINGFSWISNEVYLFSKEFITNDHVIKNFGELSEHAKWFFFEEYLQLNPLGCIPKAAYLFPFDNCFQFETFSYKSSEKKIYVQIIEPIIYIDPNLYLNAEFYKKNLPKTSCDSLFLKMESKILCDLIALNGLMHNYLVIHSNVGQLLKSFVPIFFENRIIPNTLIQDLSTEWLYVMEKKNEKIIQNHQKHYGYEMENEIIKKLENNILVWERKSSSGELHKIQKYKSVPSNDNNNNNNKKSTVYSIKSSKSEMEQQVELFKNGEFSNQLLNRKDCKIKTPQGKFSLYGFKSGFLPFISNQQNFQFCLIVLGIEKDAQVKTPKLPESKLRASAATPLAIFPFEVVAYSKRVLKYSNKKNDDFPNEKQQGKMEIDHLLPKKSLSPFDKFVQLFGKKESKEEEDEYITVTENRIVYGNEAKCAQSIIDNDFTYFVNKKILISDFDLNDFNDCGKGIHFFLTQMEAIEFITGIKCVAEDSIIGYDKVEKLCSFEF